MTRVDRITDTSNHHVVDILKSALGPTESEA